MKILITLLSLFVIAPAFAQEKSEQAKKQPPFSEPPKLEFAFEDIFETDSRRNYKITGDVKYEKGKLTLGKDSRIKREFKDAGPWVEIEIDLEFPQLTEDGQTSEFKVWLELKDNETAKSETLADTCIWFRQKRVKENTVSAAFFITAHPKDDRRSWTSVRSPLTLNSDLPSGLWKLKFRNAMWSAEHSNGIQFQSDTYLDGVVSSWSVESSRATIGSIKTRHSANRVIASSTLERVKRANELIDNLDDLAKSTEHQVLENKLAMLVSTNERLIGSYHPITANSILVFADHVAEGPSPYNASAIFRKATQVFSKTYGEDHPWYAACLNDFGLHLHWMGDYQNAHDQHTKAMEVRRKVYGAQSIEYSVSLNNLGLIYKETGAYEKAEPYFVQACEIDKAILGDESEEYSIAINNLALLYQDMGQFEKAKTLLIKAEAIDRKNLGEMHSHYATAASNLGMIYLETGELFKAGSFLNKAKRIREKLFGKDHLSYATSVNNVGLLAQELGNLDQALNYFREAQLINERVYGKEHFEYSICLNNIGRVQQALKLYTDAEKSLIAALKIDQSSLGPEHPNVATSFANLGFLYQELKAPEKAEKNFSNAIKIIRKNFERYSAIQTEIQQMSFQDQYQFLLDAYLANCEKGTDHREAFELSINWKGTVLIRQRAFRQLEKNPQTKKLLDEFQRVIQQLYVHLERKDSTKEWSVRLDQLQKRKTDLERMLNTKNASFRRTSTWLTLEQIQNSIPENGTFISFTKYFDSSDSQTIQLLAFVVRKNQAVQRVSLGDFATIEKAIFEFRQMFQDDSDDLAKHVRASKALYKKLIEPIKKFLSNSATILISPDGELGLVPFAALTQPDSRYLIEDYKIMVVPVPQLISESHSRPKPKKNNDQLLLVGDVAYSHIPDSKAKVSESPNVSQLRGTGTIIRSAKKSWSPLAEAGKEVGSIKKIYADKKPNAKIKLLIGGQATEANFRESAAKAHTLHIATHGFFADPKFAPQSTTGITKKLASLFLGRRKSLNISSYKNKFHPGLLSGLVFAGANVKDLPTYADDGIMTADEIALLDLKDIDLVTLSACETGIGKSAGGEGLIGIQRAFQIAGAKTTIASLWKVDDLATRKLMEQFYRNVHEKEMTKLSALTEAQRWLLQNPALHSDITRGRIGKAKQIQSRKDGKKDLAKIPESKRLHPRFWAAWILSGEWN